MSPDEATILVVLTTGTSIRSVFSHRAGIPRAWAVTRWGRLSGPFLRNSALAAILYEVGAGRAQHLRCHQRLKSLALDVPLLPFRVTRRKSGRTGFHRDEEGVSDGAVLEAPLEPRLLGPILARERHIAELRRNTSRVLGKVRRQEARQKVLAAVVRATGRELDSRRIVEAAMCLVSRFMKLRAWMVLLLDQEQGVLVVEQTGGAEAAGLKGRRTLIGEGLAGRAAQRKRAILLVRGDDPPVVAGGVAPAPGLSPNSCLAVPLLSRGRVIGVVETIDRGSSRPLAHEDARLLAFLLEPAAVALDNALLLRKSEVLSITDDLTRLYNSRFLNATLRREVERSRRYRTPVSLIFLDLDGFKEVNDQHGHLAGSRTLVEVGAVIRSTVRGIDVVSRFGGDEFTVILPQTGARGARIIAERIRRGIAEADFLASYGLKVRITASIGIATFPDHGESKDDLIARADQAMYAVKGSGKNGVALAEAERRHGSLGREAG